MVDIVHQYSHTEHQVDFNDISLYIGNLATPPGIIFDVVDKKGTAIVTNINKGTAVDIIEFLQKAVDNYDN